MRIVKERALMEDNPLHQILHPTSIAWAGASNNFQKMGTIQLLNLTKGGFKGAVYPIHPSEKTVLGLPAYRSARDLPEVPDLAVLVVPTRVVAPLMEDLGRRGVKRAIVTSGGFREMGPGGRRMEEELAEVAGRHGMRFVGPNCIGVINERCRLNTTFFPLRDEEPGTVGMASQSGTYVTQTQLYLKNRGIRFSKAISVGNEANIDVIDCMEYLAADEDTRAVLLYLEGIRRGRRFVEVARRIVKNKPVVALYVGGTEAGARSGTSHTGALAGDDGIYNGMLTQSGVLRAGSVEELYAWGITLASQPPMRGRRVCLLSHSGGPVTSMADACERAGLVLPVFSDGLQGRLRELLPATAAAANPVDLTFSIDQAVLAKDIPQRVLESNEVDGLIIHGIMGSSFREILARQLKDFIDVPIQFMEDIDHGLLGELVTFPQRYGKPVLCSSFMEREDNCTRYLQDHGIPVFYGPEKAVQAMAALARYGEMCRR
jgi:acyl-CoA synthetase (NDP forming)